MKFRPRLSRHCLSISLALSFTVIQAAHGQVEQAVIGDAEIPRPAPPPAPLPAVSVSPEIEGDLLSIRQHYLDAIQAYRRAPRDSAVIANKIGVAYHHMFDIADARKNYERAIQLDPKFAQPYNNLGATYHADKNYSRAERLYLEAIRLKPDCAAFYGNLGIAYFFQGNAKKGAEAYRQALALDPQVFDSESGARIEEAADIKDLAKVNYFLAKTYAQAGMNDRALGYLRKALGEGFNDRKKLMGDPELAALRETSEFVKLLLRQNLR